MSMPSPPHSVTLGAASSSSVAHDATPRPVAAVLLAAGKGTRMHSTLHKVLYPIAGLPMIRHLLNTVTTLAPQRVVVVVGALREQLEAALPDVDIAVQDPPLGTAHAVLSAQAALRGFEGDVLILYGDAPLVTPDILQRMVHALHTPIAGQDPVIAVLGFRPENPGRYGRIDADAQGRITKMVEYQDATEAERRLDLCNSGMMAVRAEVLFALLAQVSNANAQKEYYLPDIVGIARAQGACAVVIETDPDYVAGANNRAECAALEALWQKRRRAQAMEAGTTLIAPDTVYFSYDTRLASDVTIEPHVWFGKAVQVDTHAVIHAFSYLEGCTIGAHASIGPFARVRPGTMVKPHARVGNFVEIKNTTLGEGAKVNHLSYVGDADVGDRANIGAGTITCNYDGFHKHKTQIGAGAFIGSNTALVAPVMIGAEAMIGAGSTITRDVEAQALGLARSKQTILPGWAQRFRARVLKK